MRIVGHGSVWFTPEVASRVQGFLERQRFTVTPEKSGSKRVKLEARSRFHYLTPKAYSFLQRFAKEKPSWLTAPLLEPGLRPGIGSSAGEIPAGESGPTTGRFGEWKTPF